MNSIHALQLRIKNYFLKNKARNLILLVTMIFFLILFYFNSWIGDDAFITMRVADNLIHGYGLVWNIGERVQVFSHPLWLFLATFFYFFIRNPYYSLYVLSLITSLLTVFLVLQYFAVHSKLIIVIGLLLTSSMSFIDFSFSGLENPLSHLILVVNLILIFFVPDSPKRLFLVTFVAALSALNRLDTILIYSPILVYEYITSNYKWRAKLKNLLLGFSPLWMWFLFSFLYYGFPFPNTFYAKVAINNLSLNWYLSHGLHYFINFIKWDPISFLVIISGVVFAIAERKIKKVLLMAGGILYLLYVFYIGGDFMSGRFFSVVFLLSLVLLTDVDLKKIMPGVNKINFKYIVLLGIFCCFVPKYPPILIKCVNVHYIFDEYQIANEKYYYYKLTNWQNYDPEKPLASWSFAGFKMKISGEGTFVFCNIGFVGYNAGPGVHIIDGFGLADPLLARLPTYDNSRIGHFARHIPEGYEETIKDHYKNQIVNQSLEQYYDKLGVLIHDPIFSKGRIKEIFYFTMGKYNYLLENYNESYE